MQRVLDATGVGLSALCLIHCLILPIAASVLPLLGVVAETEWVHWAFVALAAPVGILAIRPFLYRRPINWIAPVTVCLGISLLFIGALDFPNHEWGAGFTVVGALSLSSAHIYNWRNRHRIHQNAVSLTHARVA